MSNEIGWGGGPAPGFTTSDPYMLDVPQITPGMSQDDINNIIQQLAMSAQRLSALYSALNTSLLSTQTTVAGLSGSTGGNATLTTTPAACQFYGVYVDITSAQYIAANATPIQIVASATIGAGRLLIPIWMGLETSIGGSGYSLTPSLTARYIGTSGVETLGAFTVTNTTNRTEMMWKAAAISTGSVVVNSTRANKGVELFHSTAGITGGSGSFRFNMVFYVTSALF